MNGAFEAVAVFVRRSHAERRLLALVGLLFLSAHVLLRFRSLQETRERLRCVAAGRRIIAADVHELVWCTDRVNHRLPGRHSCLINALVCDAVACASGIPIDFRIGTARSEAGYRFHAWIDYLGHTIIGAEHTAFIPFPNV